VPLHVAATGPNLEVLRLLLQKGASVHMRNKAGRTPLFLAANAGMEDRVQLLRQSGAHLHPEESGVAKVLCEKAGTQAAKCWELAGVVL
jgi:lysophospholipase